MELGNAWVIKDEHFFSLIIWKFLILTTAINLTYNKIDIFTLAKYYVGDQVKNEMGGVMWPN
jgi:hypothetical protein